MGDEPQPKPSSVPADAVWEDDGWELGAQDASGRKVGTWKMWRESGEACGVTEYGTGSTRMSYERWHPDGEIAQCGEKDLVTDRWIGVMRWTRQATPSPEDRFYPNMVDASVRAFEVELDDGYIVTERCFDEDGRRVTYTGMPEPERPQGVSPHAFLTEDDTLWLQQRRFLGDNRLGGARRLWDRNGAPQLRELYRPDGSLAERDKYESGALWSTMRTEPNGDFTTSYFHYNSDPRVVSTSTLYRNDQNDRETTYFDKAGVRAFSVRMEQVAPHHVRRYDNGVLVFEAIWSSDPAQPPINVAYYEPDGRKLVSYTPSEPGKGVWRLHAADGHHELAIDELDEHANNEYGNWNAFLPGFARYSLDREHADVVVVRESFRERYEREVIQTTLAAMTPPRELTAALGPGSWAKVESAMGGARELPTFVLGVLADDPAIATYALERIWGQIEHQHTVYEATYRVATALAAMLPILTERPTVQRRVFDFLCEVIDLGSIRADRTAFAKLVDTLRGAELLLEAWADGSTNDPRTNQAQRLLARIGSGTARAEREMRGAATREQRAFAACAYAAAAPKRRKATLQAALELESDPFVRFVIAQYLVRADKVTTPEVLAAIEPYLVDASEIARPFADLEEFLGDDVGELILATLPDAAIAKYMEQVVDELGSQNLLTQVSYLETIFRIVLANGMPPRPTPLQKRALRAVASVIDESPNFVNHMEVFRAHGVPYDSFALREVAAGRGAKPPAKKPARKPTKKPAVAKKPTKKPAGKKTSRKTKKKTAKKPAAKTATRTANKKPARSRSTKR